MKTTSCFFCSNYGVNEPQEYFQPKYSTLISDQPEPLCTCSSNKKILYIEDQLSFLSMFHTQEVVRQKAWGLMIRLYPIQNCIFHFHAHLQCYNVYNKQFLQFYQYQIPVIKAYHLNRNIILKHLYRLKIFQYFHYIRISYYQ